MAIALCKMYDPSIPLVEPSDQRHRVAKMAVSIAAQCASMTDDLQNLIVLPEHVEVVGSLLRLFYDKEAMGYNLYSRKVQVEEESFDPTVPELILKEQVGQYGKRFALELLRLDQFSERSFGTIIPMQGAFIRTLIQQLYLSNCIRLVHLGRSEYYEKTPLFVQFLKKYLGI